MTAQIIISNILIGISVIFMFFGMLGLLRFKNFHGRLLATAKVDTMAILVLLVGLMVRHGFTFFSAKLLMVFVIMLFLNPLVSHVMVRAAYKAGYMTQGDLIETFADDEEKDDYMESLETEGK